MKSYKKLKTLRNDLNDRWSSPLGWNASVEVKVFFKTIIDLKDKPVSEIKPKLLKAIEGARGSSSGRYHYYGSDDTSKPNVISLTEEDRFLINYQGSSKSILSICEFSINDLVSLYDPSYGKSVTAQFYMFAINHGTTEQAKKILKSYYKKYKLDNLKGKSLVLESDRSKDYIPLFELKSSRGVKVANANFKNYSLSIKQKSILYDNPFDKDAHRTYVTKYGKLFAKVPSTVDTKGIKLIDLIESDMAKRSEYFRLNNWEKKREMKKLLKENEEKLSKLVIEYFNTEFANGKKPKTFIKTYLRLKEFYEYEGKTFIEDLNLNEDLQSLVLFDMMQ